MDERTLNLAIQRLAELPLGNEHSSHPYPDAIGQFDALLRDAKIMFADRSDIQALQSLSGRTTLYKWELGNSVQRLKAAIELTRDTPLAEEFRRIRLPPDATPELLADVNELGRAVELGLEKSVLLLAGSVAEALLLLRHPDQSDRGPGLARLVSEAQQKHLVPRDVLRHLEALTDYRDLIHPRAQKRLGMQPSPTRVEAAVMALRLLCDELEDVNLRY